MKAADNPAEVIGIVDGPPLLFHLHDSGDSVSNFLAHGHLWHPQIVRLLSTLVQPGTVFVDVGAHIGLLSVVAARAAGPSARVIAFEPDAENRALLARNAAANGVTLDIRPAAIGARPGRATLHRSAENRAIHSLTPSSRLGSTEEVVVSTLGEELSEPDRTHIVKLDVQGDEPDILGATMDLWDRFARPPFLIVEVNPAQWNKRDPGFQTLRAFCRRYRYDIHIFMTSEGPTAMPPVVTWRTFLSICDDACRYWRDHEEFDILLFPPVAGG